MIITLLLEQGTTPQVSNFLRRSQCGWIGRDPLVCCESTSGTTDRARTPTPTPNNGGRITPITVEPITVRPVTQAPVTTRPITQRPDPVQPNSERTLEPIDSENSNPNILRPPFCGRSNAQTSRIVNGAPANPGKLKFLFNIRRRN